MNSPVLTKRGFFSLHDASSRYPTSHSITYLQAAQTVRARFVDLLLVLFTIFVINAILSSNAINSVVNEEMGSCKNLPPIAYGMLRVLPSFMISASTYHAAAEHDPALVPPSE